MNHLYFVVIISKTSQIAFTSPSIFLKECELNLMALQIIYACCILSVSRLFTFLHIWKIWGSSPDVIFNLCVLTLSLQVTNINVACFFLASVYVDYPSLKKNMMTYFLFLITFIPGLKIWRNVTQNHSETFPTWFCRFRITFS